MSAPKPFHIWEGVFPNIEAAKAVGPGFSGDTWINRSVESAREALADLKAGRPLQRPMRQRNAVLPASLAALLATQEKVRLLDVGGGVGFGYLAAAEIIREIGKVDYHIAEVEAVCRAGRALFGDSNPKFFEMVPDGNYDLVYASSTMQYIRDWRGAIAKFTSLKPKVLLISDLLTGSFATFATLQNYYESRIPYWMYNYDEFVAEFARRGYRLVMKADASSTVLGKEASVPMENFPENLRVRSALHLMFAPQS